MPTRVFLVRHGATTLSAEDRFAGETEVELSEEGREQLHHLAARLAREPLAAVCASPMRRTLESAKILAAPHGFHVFRVEERLDARDITFEEARPGLRISLAEELSAKAVEDAIAEARKAFPVTVLEDHLPFPYVGTNPKAAAAR